MKKKAVFNRTDRSGIEAGGTGYAGRGPDRAVATGLQRESSSLDSQ
jgi:hypothetical protein